MLELKPRSQAGNGFARHLATAQAIGWVVTVLAVRSCFGSATSPVLIKRYQ